MNVLGPTWKYKVVICCEDWPSVEEWCNKQFGSFGERWYKIGIDPAQWLLDDEFKTVWYFKTEADAVLFKLRWA